MLLLRVVAGSTLLMRASLALWNVPPPPVLISYALLATSAILLIPGLWTPIAGTIIAITAVSQFLMAAADPSVSILYGTIGGALAMLGPGLWSVDARLFGWKRVEISTKPRS